MSSEKPENSQDLLNNALNDSMEQGIELIVSPPIIESPEEKIYKVMVVDDEILNLKLIEAMLKPQGYKVILASDGNECLEKVDQDPPDIILLDIMMPKMNGFEVAAKLRAKKHLAIIPIVMVTALQDVADRVKALEVGADDFLTKPVDRMELRARVRSLLKVKDYNDYMLNYQKILSSEVAFRTKELQKSNQKLVRSSLETIHRLSRAAEYKDEDTGAHISRMSHSSAIIAKKMGLNKTACERILYATPMHDVGKIGIPDRILMKNGPLNDDEWKIMRLHTVIGAQILENSEIGFIRLAEMIALNHHEKWNGEGYPNRLKGKKIPLAARIVAIADVFDALMSKRPYKAPLSLEQTLDIIKQSCGLHFDPEVYEAFYACLDDILEVWKNHQEVQSPTHILLDSYRE